MTHSQQLAKAYLDAVLERPGMYVGSCGVRELEMILINLLNLYVLVFQLDCKPKALIFKIYAERYGVGAGSGGPSGPLSRRYEDDSTHEGIRAFYRSFVDAVLDAPPLHRTPRRQTCTE